MSYNYILFKVIEGGWSLEGGVDGDKEDKGADHSMGGAGSAGGVDVEEAVGAEP